MIAPESVRPDSPARVTPSQTWRQVCGNQRRKGLTAMYFVIRLDELLLMAISLLREGDWPSTFKLIL